MVRSFSSASLFQTLSNISSLVKALPGLEASKYSNSNSFLDKFYKDPEKYAFPLEVSFLVERFNQMLRHFSQRDIFSKFFISDYFFDKSFFVISNCDDIGDDIQFNNFGQIYTTGHFNKGSNNYANYDIITMILHPNGGLLWSDTFNGSSDSSDIPNLIYLNNNDFYIAGSTVNSNQMRNMLLLKYSGTVGINFSPINQKVLIYPNPFDCQINIDIPEILVNSKIEILELSGRILFEGTASEEHSTISLGNLKTGCYIYRIHGTNQEPIIGIIDKN